MGLIKVSETVKRELEELKAEGEFKSLDAVIRHYINSSFVVNGGIFLGSGGLMRKTIWHKNIRDPMTSNNFTHMSADTMSPIFLYQCLHCGNIALPRSDELVIVPNCVGCGKGMARITIKVEP